MLPKTTGIFRIHTKELKYLQSGTAVLKLNLVASSKFKTKDGEEKESVCWIEATSFGKQAEIINQHFSEKDRIYITGELKLEIWAAQDGSKRSKHSIGIESFEFIEKKGTQSQPTSYTGANGDVPVHEEPHNPQSEHPAIPEIDINESELPF